MYEKDGEKYFVVDSHMHYWDASPENWVKGAENYAKGWIDCFHAYQGLGPPETHWTIEHFQEGLRGRPDEGRLRGRVRRQGDLPADLPQGVVRRRASTRPSATARSPRSIRASSSSTPASTRATATPASRSSRRTSRAGACKGVKLYTAEWNNGSRGYKLSDPEAYRFLAKAQELGIKNIHVHKGPTIWPLDKDAFDVSDVDHAATDFPELNFIVEHVGLPRIEDFCFMATQEPNVYAGLSVVIGGLMHARPKFFAKVMGELLFWVGEDKMTFGSDYSIWEPKWQIEGFVDWDYPERRVLRLPPGQRGHQEEDPRPERRQALRHRGAGGVPARGRRRHRPPRTTPSSWSTGPTCDRAGHRIPRRAGRGARPGAGRAGHRRSASSRRAPCPPTATCRCGSGCRRTSARPTSPS